MSAKISLRIGDSTDGTSTKSKMLSEIVTDQWTIDPTYTIPIRLSTYQIKVKLFTYELEGSDCTRDEEESSCEEFILRHAQISLEISFELYMFFFFAMVATSSTQHTCMHTYPCTDFAQASKYTFAEAIIATIKMHTIRWHNLTKLENMPIFDLFQQITNKDQKTNKMPIIQMNNTYYHSNTFQTIENKLIQMLQKEMHSFSPTITSYDKGYMYGRIYTFLMIQSIFSETPLKIYPNKQQMLQNTTIDISYFIFAFQMISNTLKWTDFQRILLFLNQQTIFATFPITQTIIQQTHFMTLDFHTACHHIQNAIIRDIQQNTIDFQFVEGLKDGFAMLKINQIIATNIYSVREIIRNLFNINIPI